MEVTVKTAQQLRLTEEEFELIKKNLSNNFLQTLKIISKNKQICELFNMLVVDKTKRKEFLNSPEQFNNNFNFVDLSVLMFFFSNFEDSVKLPEKLRNLIIDMFMNKSLLELV